MFRNPDKANADRAQKRTAAVTAQFYAVVLACMLVLLPSCRPAFSPNFELVSLHALKGEIFSGENDSQVRTGGVSLISSQLKELKRVNNAVVFMADNNMIHGTPAAYFSSGEYVIDLLNYMQCDLLIADSREFYYGSNRLAELAQQATFPIVSANLRLSEDGSTPDYLHKYYYNDEINLLVIGLSSPNLIERNLPANIHGLEIIDPVRAIGEALEEFEAQYAIEIDADRAASMQRPFIVVNLVSYKISNDSDPADIEAITAFDNVDLFILGERDLPGDGFIPAEQRSWELFAWPEPPMPEGLANAREQFHLPFGRTVLVDDSRTDGGRLLDRISIRNARVDSYREYELRSDLLHPDADISEFLFGIREQSEAQLSRQIAWTADELTHRFSGQSRMSDLVTDAMRLYSGSDVSFLNSGAIRGSLDAGPISLYDAYSILPFESGLHTLQMSGADIRRVIEQSVTYFQDPEREKGFLQVSGLAFAIGETDSGYEMQADSLRIGGEPIDDSREYVVAVSTYLYSGGDGYSDFASMQLIQSYDETLLSSVIWYLEGLGNAGTAGPTRIALNLN